MAGKRAVYVVLGVTAIFAVVDIAWLPYSSLTVDTANFVDLAKVAAFLLLVYGVGSGVRARLATDQSRMARFIDRTAESLQVLVRSAALFIPLGFVGGVFMYLAASTGLPLRDAALAELDAALGFDWPLFLSAANASPWLGTLLVVAYHSVGPQIPLVFIVLATIRCEARLREFIALIAVSSLLTGIGMALVPAAGAYAYFNPPPDAFSSFTSNAGMWHYAELMQLRSGEPFLYLADRTKGLVTFPSFHTVLAIAITYAFRGYRWIFPPLAALNTLMIVATVPEGGHHVIDVIAGFAIAFLSIAFVRMVERHSTVIARLDARRGGAPL